MVTRLPTHLDTFSLSSFGTSGPSEPSSVWRGIFLVSGTRASDISSNVEIRVTGVETSGNIESHTWPQRIIFSITAPHALPVLPQLREYIRTRTPPVSVATFLPERLREPNQNVINQTHFRSLSRLLWDSQLVAIVPLPPPDSLVSPSSQHGRHGMLIFPAENSSALLIGAIFLTPEDEFPYFMSPTQASTSTSMSDLSGYDSSGQGGSVPISPTVLYHQDQRRRASSQSYSSLRTAPALSSYRYNPIAAGGRPIPGPSQGHRLPLSQQLLPTVASQTISNPFLSDYPPSSYPPDYPSLPNNPSPDSHPPASPAYSTQTDSPLEYHTAYPSTRDRDASGGSSGSRHSE